MGAGAAALSNGTAAGVAPGGQAAPAGGSNGLVPPCRAVGPAIQAVLEYLVRGALHVAWQLAAAVPAGSAALFLRVWQLSPQAVPAVYCLLRTALLCTACRATDLLCCVLPRNPPLLPSVLCLGWLAVNE